MQQIADLLQNFLTLASYQPKHPIFIFQVYDQFRQFHPCRPSSFGANTFSPQAANLVHSSRFAKVAKPATPVCQMAANV